MKYFVLIFDQNVPSLATRQWFSTFNEANSYKNTIHEKFSAIVVQSVL